MNLSNKQIIGLVGIHVLFGFSFFWLPILSKVYSISIVLISLFLILKNQNTNNEVLFASAYIVGAEVFIRMTHGNFFYEFAKYVLIIYSVIGIFYSGFSKSSILYFIYILVLLPGILVATETLNSTTDIRTNIAFNISGPISLGIASIYTMNRKLSFNQLSKILRLMALPIISIATYTAVYTPEIIEKITNTGSNPMFSGGFGPNQVATILGLGMFILIANALMTAKNKTEFIISMLLAGFVSYRGILTFSRGGMITGLAMTIILLIVIYIISKAENKFKISYFMIFITCIFIAIWSYSAFQTGGLIVKRYSNQNALGKEKSDRFTGREKLALNELNLFLENPIFGAGVSKGSEIRAEKEGVKSASHDEITRLLAEHGLFGIVAILILIIAPLVLRLNNTQHVYFFSFYIFWFLTINHAAMRTAAPSFIYALTLLNINFDED